MPYIDPAARARLSDCRERLADLRRQRQRATDHRDAARQALNSVSSGMSASELVNSPEGQRVEAAMKDLTDLQMKIASVEQEENYLLGRLSGAEGVGARESFLSDPQVCEELRVLATSSNPVGDRIMGEFKSRDQLLAEFEGRRNMLAAAGDVTLPSDGARTSFYGISPALRRELRILDLLPVQPMDVGAFDYLVEAAPGTTAAETAELAVKPSGAMAPTEATCKPATIAEWYRIARQTLADVPGLGTTIQTRVQYEVELRLENQIIAGSGIGVNILGITNVSGIGAPASSAGDTVNADLVANAVTSVRQSNGIPNAIVMNPVDVAKAIKVKAAGSGERLDSDGAFGATPTQLWGLPLIQSNGMAAGTALVGDFQRGATLFLREGFNIRISDSDQSDFVSNAVKILGELRAGLAIWQPSAFAKVTLSFAA